MINLVVHCISLNDQQCCQFHSAEDLKKKDAIVLYTITLFSVQYIVYVDSLFPILTCRPCTCTLIYFDLSELSHY